VPFAGVLFKVPGPAGRCGAHVNSQITMTDLSADQIIALLALTPHPEGGCYRETFRDGPGPDGRARSTAIYFLLRAGETSRWHRVDAAEVWHWYAGSSLQLGLASPTASETVHILGPDLARGARPQIVVPAGYWQRAASTGGWTLVGCTVAPGFAFSGFEIAADGFEPGRH
jgi:uncharacterized protein